MARHLTAEYKTINCLKKIMICSFVNVWTGYANWSRVDDSINTSWYKHDSLIMTWLQHEHELMQFEHELKHEHELMTARSSMHLIICVMTGRAWLDDIMS